MDRQWFRATFSYESLYDVGNEQGDWNKLVGIATNPLNHADNTAFVAWRYFNNQIEIVPYYNINGTNNFTNDYSKILTSGKINNDKNFSFTVQCSISFLTGEITYGTKNACKVDTIPMLLQNKFKKWKSSRVQPYFGGNSVPNKDVKINIEWL
jgi:hypothetical protein